MTMPTYPTAYTFRDLLHLARLYKHTLGFSPEEIHEWLSLARLYWKECWEEAVQQCQDAGE